MAETSLKARIQEDMKQAMRSQDKPRLNAIRLILAAVKQHEVDQRAEADDTVLLQLLDKMSKQRRDSIAQFKAAARQDLADQESYELSILQSYLPTSLTASEIAALITEAIQLSGAQSVKEIGKAMALLKPKVQGRADMAAVSSQLKQKLEQPAH